MTLTPADPQHWTLDSARSMPFWFNPTFKAPALNTEQFWRDTLRLNTVKDMFHDDGSDYSMGELVDEIHRLARVEGDWVKMKKQWVSIRRFIQDWNRLLGCIPYHMVCAIQSKGFLKGYSHVAQRMMRKLNWRPGEGLGPQAQGRAEPVPSNIGQTDRKGLGLRTKSDRKKQKDLIAIWRENAIIYGVRQGMTLRVYALNVKGRPTLTGETLYFKEEEVRSVLYWNGGVAGIAESTFPHPKEWRLGDIDKPLDKIQVKELTAAFTRKLTTQPSCIQAWLKRFPTLDMRSISERYSVGIITPKDFGSHYKLILHRAFFTNKINPDASSPNCRLCGLVPESITHFGECPCLKPAFEIFRKLDGGNNWDNVTLNLFGQDENKRTIAPGVSLVHFIVWKFIIIHMTQVALEGTTFRIEVVLDHAKKRILRKIDTARFNLRNICMAANARETSPKAPQYHKWINGIGEVKIEDDMLKIELSPAMLAWLDPPD